MMMSLDYFLDDNLDRPELLILAEMTRQVRAEEDDNDEAFRKIFNIHYVPSTKNSDSKKDIMALMQTTFDRNERTHARKILEHDDTQAFNFF